MPKIKNYKADIPMGKGKSCKQQPIIVFHHIEKNQIDEKIIEDSTTQTLDFGQFEFEYDIACTFAQAFYELYLGKKPVTIHRAFQLFASPFLSWLKTNKYIQKSLVELITDKVFNDYLHFIQNKSWKLNTKTKCLSLINNLFAQIAKISRLQPPYKKRKFILVGSYKEEQIQCDKLLLTKKEWNTLRQSALNDIKSIWNNFDRGQNLLANQDSALTIRDKKSGLKPELDIILRIIRDQFDGIFPEINELRKNHHHLLRAMKQWVIAEKNQQITARLHLLLDNAGFPPDLSRYELPAFCRAGGKTRAQLFKEKYCDGSKNKAFTTLSTKSVYLPTLSVLKKVAGSLNASLLWLMSGEGNPYQKDPPHVVLAICKKDKWERFSLREEIEKYLYATIDTLVPYLVFLATETGVNRDPQLGWKRNMMIPNLFLEHTFMLLDEDEQVKFHKNDSPAKGEQLHDFLWTKGRSSTLQKAIFVDNGQWSAVSLMRQILAMTEPLLPHLELKWRNHLWVAKLARKEAHKKLKKLTQFLPITETMFRHGINLFCKRHQLDIAKVNHQIIRRTLLANEFIESHHDFAYTQAIAGHTHPQTTDVYLQNNVIRRESDKLIHHLQERKVHSVREGNMSLMLAPNQLPNHSAPLGNLVKEALDEGKNVTMAGGICKNIKEGYKPGTKKGIICKEFFGCMTCPGAILVPVPKLVAKWLRLRDHLEKNRLSIHPQRWQEYYEPEFYWVNERIAQVSQDIIEEAKKVASTLPFLPPLT